MLARFVTRKCIVNDAEKEMVKKKLAKLDKFFAEDTEATVNFAELKNDRKKVEVTILYKDTFYRGEIEDADYVSAIEKVVDVIEGQIRKNKTRLKKRLRDGAFDKYSKDLVESTHEVVKTKKFKVGVMDVEEAITEMELLSHEFFLFRNSQTGNVNLVYRRRDGEYGVLIPEDE